MNRPSIARCRARGFTLLEILTVLGIASVLSSLASPSFQSSLQKSRRADALVAMTQLQIAQERRYANRRSYGTLAQLRPPERSSAGHYRLEVLSADDEGYTFIARATGAQAGDAECRQLMLTIAGGVSGEPGDSRCAGTPRSRRTPSRCASAGQHEIQARLLNH